MQAARKGSAGEKTSPQRTRHVLQKETARQKGRKQYGTVDLVCGSVYSARLNKSPEDLSPKTQRLGGWWYVVGKGELLGEQAEGALKTQVFIKQRRNQVFSKLSRKIRDTLQSRVRNL